MMVFILMFQSNLFQLYDANLIGGKTKGAAWFVSQCRTSSRRENVIEKLQVNNGFNKLWWSINFRNISRLMSMVTVGNWSVLEIVRARRCWIQSKHHLSIVIIEPKQEFFPSEFFSDHLLYFIWLEDSYVYWIFTLKLQLPFLHSLRELDLQGLHHWEIVELRIQTGDHPYRVESKKSRRKKRHGHSIMFVNEEK